MKLLRGLTIRNKITIFNVVIIMITLYTLGYVSNSVYFDYMLNRAVDSSYTEMFMINNNLDNLVNNMESQARLLSITEGIQSEMESHDYNEFKSLDIIPETVTRAYYDIILSNPLSMSASLLTSQNRILYFGDVESTSVEAIMTDEIIEVSRKMIKPQWVGPYEVDLENGSKQNVFVVVKSIVSRYTGEFLGTVFVYVKESDISSIYINELIESNSMYHIINDDDIVISSIEASELYQPYTITIGSEVAAQVSKENQNRIIDIDGQSFLQNTYYYEKLDWRIIHTIPLEEITIEISDVTKVIIGVGLACTLLGVISSAIISRSITKPITSLTRSMKRIRSGNLNERIHSKHISESEVGQLSRGFNKLMDDMQSLMGDIETEQERRRDYEFKLIQSQIKPHFLYNTIETIISCVKLDMKDTALKVSKSLANFYRGSLSRGNDIITIGEEVDLTRNYLEIQGFRYAEYLSYELEIEEGLKDYLIQKLMLQPIVENAIYHGIKALEYKGLLKVKAWSEEDRIIFSVWDNGVGIEPSQVDKILSEEALKRDGFGLGSMNQRIKLLHGDGYGIQVKSELNVYTEVIMTIPKLSLSDMAKKDGRQV